MPLLPVGEKNISEYGGFFRRITFSNGDYEGQAWGGIHFLDNHPESFPAGEGITTAGKGAGARAGWFALTLWEQCSILNIVGQY
jgi:hypothetical protein